MTQSIAIIGAGPCGLTLARLLECQGIDYIIYEKDESESFVSGGSLDLDPEHGQNAIRQAGLFEEFKKLARYDDTVFTIADKHGKKLLQLAEGRDAPEIDRVDLRKMLLASVPKEKVRWGHTLTSAKLDAEDRPVLQFSNGTEASGFRLIVGTDGAWSKIRSLVRPATEILINEKLANMIYYCRSRQVNQSTRTEATSSQEFVLIIPSTERPRHL